MGEFQLNRYVYGAIGSPVEFTSRVDAEAGT
jgi:hypothetical protein